MLAFIVVFVLKFCGLLHLQPLLSRVRTKFQWAEFLGLFQPQQAPESNIRTLGLAHRARAPSC